MNNRTKNLILKSKENFLWENNHFPKFGTTSFSRNVLIMVAKKIGMLTDDATFVGVFDNNILLCFSSFYVPR